jgi:DNA-binding transcriptional ArsR family regulator
MKKNQQQKLKRRADILKALAHPSRLLMVEELGKSGCVQSGNTFLKCALTNAKDNGQKLCVSQSFCTISQKSFSRTLILRPALNSI